VYLTASSKRVPAEARQAAVIGGSDSTPLRPASRHSLQAWTPVPRSASSSPPAAPRSVSIDYYTRLEKGNVAGVSDEVLGAVARALQLDEAERTHLFDLARAARPRRPTARQRGKQRVPASVQHILDSATISAAFVRNGRLDLLAANALAQALYAAVYADPARPANLARFCFLDPRSHELYPEWDDIANSTVALLRTEAGRDPLNRDLSDLVGELATTSPQFRTRWAAHDVQLHHIGVKRFRHPAVGMIEVAYTTMDLPAQPGLVLTFYTAEPGSSSEDALRLLASWAATIPESHRQDAAGQRVAPDQIH